MRGAAAAGRAQPVVACHALARQMTGLLRHRNDNDLRRAKARKKRGFSLGSGPLRDAQSNSGIFSLLTLTTPGAIRDTMLMEYEHQYALPPLDWTWEAPPPAAGFSFAWRRSGNGHVRALPGPARPDQDRSNPRYGFDRSCESGLHLKSRADSRG